MLETVRLESVREEYLLGCQIEGKARGTLKIYELVTRLFVEYLNGENITPTQIRGFLFWLSTERNTTTVNIYCRALRTFIRWMVREGYLEDYPMQNISTPKVPSKFPNVLTEDEIRSMMKVSKKSPRDYAILTFLLDTGVRSSECCGLALDDLSLATMSAKIYGKGGKERIVFFSTHTAKAIARWMSVRPDVMEDVLFLSAKKKQGITTHGLLEVVQRVGARAGIRKQIGVHTFRHTFATLFIKNGGDAHTLQRLMGHSNILMSQRYVDFISKDLAEAHQSHSPVMRIITK